MPPVDAAPPAPARRKLTTLDKLKIVLRQARCPRCGEKLGELTGLEFDHEQALARGGTDDLGNIQAIHRQPCHAVKTRGAGATTRGSDIGEVAKTRRLAKDAAEFRARLLAKEPGQPRQKRSRLRGRGFSKKAKGRDHG